MLFNLRKRRQQLFTFELWTEARGGRSGYNKKPQNFLSENLEFANVEKISKKR